MSIKSLLEVTVAGHEHDRAAVLEELQEFGFLHLVPLTPEGEIASDEESRSSARDVLKFLASCPQQRRQIRDPSRFDASEVEGEARALRAKILDLTNERDELLERLELLRHWGDFEFEPLDDVGGLRLWFYAVPPAHMKRVHDSALPWLEVSRDANYHYVVVVAAEEPESEAMPVARAHVGSRSPSQLATRLEEVLEALEDAEAERISLTRWRDLFARAVDRLDDRHELARADAVTARCGPVWALRAWMPAEHADELRAWAEQRRLVLELRDPGPDDDPPTLFDNPPAVRGGEDLVHFYTTPAYAVWDPTTVVFFSFSVFFAMIVADAGYALVLGAIVAVLWRRLGKSDGGARWRPLLVTLSVASLTFGMLVGSYFGVSPDPDGFLGQVHVLDLGDSNAMMALSVAIGALHVAYACVRDALRHRTWSARLAPLGWAAAVLGGFTLWRGSMTGVLWQTEAGLSGIVGGLVLVLLFTGVGQRPLARLWEGTTALFGIAGAFGDVMSYIRLFALGLASASLAATFNDMAGQVRAAMPGVGLLFALLIFLAGHTLNFVLAVTGGFIHGLRLNVIEFFKWGVKEEGISFEPFERKESTPWTTSS